MEGISPWCEQGFVRLLRSRLSKDFVCTAPDFSLWDYIFARDLMLNRSHHPMSATATATVQSAPAFVDKQLDFPAHESV